MKDEIKISFIGDIMCEKPLLNASRNGYDYNFDSLFSPMQDLFKESDYVVGNLETISAGEKLGYTDHIYSFNTPEEFIKSIKKSGIDMVTTATNHSLDRGIEGLKKNLTVLNKYNLDHIGTYTTEEARNKVFYKDIEGVKVSFLNYTYGTNVHIIEIIDHVSDLRQLRKKCDIGLICSKKEAFGRVTIETMASRMLVIGANTGGTAEIVDDKENGLLYQSDNYKSLANRIKYAIDHNKEMDSIIEKGYRSVIEKYSISSVVDQIQRLYEKVKR